MLALISTGTMLLATPAVLFIALWLGSGRIEGAAAVGPLTAFLMWPIGTVLVGADLLGRLIRRLDTPPKQ